MDSFLLYLNQQCRTGWWKILWRFRRHIPQVITLVTGPRESCCLSGSGSCHPSISSTEKLVSMASIASVQFLSHLKTMYPTRAGRANPWYIVAAVAFSASNRPQAVPIVFQHVLEEYNNSTHLERISVARKVRDALFKTGLVCGYSRAINALLELHKVTPDDLKDTKPLRDLDAPVQEYVKRGQACFETLYGDTAPAVQNLLDSIYPDMGWFSNTIGYGLTYSFAGSLTPIETSYALVAALITMDTPLQIGWHLDGAMRAGASFEEVKAVRRIAMEVAESAGVSWSDGVPEVKNLGESER